MRRFEFGRQQLQREHLLRCATVIPGLIESHGHFPEFGEIAERIELVGVTTMEEVASRVSERIVDTPVGECVLGAGL